MNKLLFRAGHTVIHASFVGLQLPEQAVILELHVSGLAELNNGLYLPERELHLVNTGEQWAIIAGYDRYLLSSHGKVVSLFYHRTDRQRLLKVLRPTIYPGVTLVNEKGPRQVGLNRLVAQAFLPPPAEVRLRQVLPKDGNHLNVRVDNLYWADPSEVEDEAVVQYLRRRGERHYFSKLTAAEVAQARELVAQGATRQAVATKFGVSRPTISTLVSGATRRNA
ncbi:MAG: helix-turn-helix domain-containing protein [Janthinobacterium lividum]